MDAGEDEFSEASGNLFRWLKPVRSPGQGKNPHPGDFIGMSFSEVFLGRLLSSRARLRFPRYTRSAARECCSSRKLQRTATVELHNCLKKGRSPNLKDQQVTLPCVGATFICPERSLNRSGSYSHLIKDGRVLGRSSGAAQDR